MLAPVAAFVTLRTVPNGSVGLAHIPAGAAAYHVAWPCSPLVGAAGAWVAGATVGATAARAETSSTGGSGEVVVVVVVGNGGGGGATVVGVVVGVVGVVVGVDW